MVLKESCPETIVTFTERRTAVTRTSCAAGEFGPSLLQPETIREFLGKNGFKLNGGA